MRVVGWGEGVSGCVDDGMACWDLFSGQWMVVRWWVQAVGCGLDSECGRVVYPLKWGVYD